MLILRTLLKQLLPLLLAPRTSSLSLPLNTTTTTPLSISCTTPISGRFPITLPGCRPVLNWLRTLPNYRRLQDFQETRLPRIPVPGGPATPPFAWHKAGSDCGLHLGAGDVRVVDQFSFEQVRGLALDVVEECKVGGGKGWGFGGVADVGRGVGWKVTVSGFKLEGGEGGDERGAA